MVKTVLFPLCMVSAFLLLTGGCNTDIHLVSTPHLDRDFQIPPAEMKQRFYDVDRFKEMTFPLFFGIKEMPPLTEIQYGNYFGYPQSERLSWWNLCPFFIFPIPFCPCDTMVWERGRYRFTAVIAYPLFFGFKGHLWYWEVDEINPARDQIQVFAISE